MDKERSLTSRKERALAKSQRTGNLIDKHLGQLTKRVLPDDEKIHRIDELYPDAENISASYVGQIKNGLPDGKGEALFEDERGLTHVRGEFSKGILEGFSVTANFKERYGKGPDVHTYVIGRRKHGKRTGLYAELFVSSFGFDETLDWPELSLTNQRYEFGGVHVALDNIKADATGIDWKKNWFDLSELTLGVLDGQGGFRGLILQSGVVTEVNDFDLYDTRKVEKSEGEAIVESLLLEQEERIIRWCGPAGTPAEGAWITTDLQGHSIEVATSGPGGRQEIVQSKIKSKDVLEITCGERALDGQFSGIKFELNVNLDESRGPWFYENGSRQEFNLFDVTLGKGFASLCQERDL